LNRGVRCFRGHSREIENAGRGGVVKGEEGKGRNQSRNKNTKRGREGEKKII